MGTEDIRISRKNALQYQSLLKAIELGHFCYQGNLIFSGVSVVVGPCVMISGNVRFSDCKISGAVAQLVVKGNCALHHSYIPELPQWGRDLSLMGSTIDTCVLPNKIHGNVYWSGLQEMVVRENGPLVIQGELLLIGPQACRGEVRNNIAFKRIVEEKNFPERLLYHTDTSTYYMIRRAGTIGSEQYEQTLGYECVYTCYHVNSNPSVLTLTVPVYAKRFVIRGFTLTSDALSLLHFVDGE